MATGWIWVGFFDTWTQPVGPPLLLGPGPFNKRVFFFSPKPRPSGLRGPRPATSRPIPWQPNPTQSYYKK